MPSIYLTKSLWSYKFRKLTYLIRAVGAYGFLNSTLFLKRLINPNKTFIGILLAEHLGDIVACEPVIDALHKKFKNVEIYWIVKPVFAPLLIHHPGISNVIRETNILFSILISRKNVFSEFYNLHLNGLRKDPFFGTKLVNPYAEEIGLSVDNYYKSSNLLGNFSRLCHLNLDQNAPSVFVEQAKIKLPFEGNYWVLHRKSTDINREWKDEHWIQLLDLLTIDYGIHVVEIGTNDPLEYSNKNFLNLVGKTSIEETCMLIKSARFFLGIDSGPTHIANAFQIPALILCGHFANFKKYMSYSGAYQEKEGIAHIYFNARGSARELPFLEVWEALQKTILTSKLTALKAV
jgi:heptosyltransferase-3